MTRLPPVPPWSPSTDAAVRQASQGRVRLLTDADTPALAALARRDPVANVFVESLLEAGRRAGPRGGAGGTLFLGVPEDPDAAAPAGALRAAAWVGSNVVPVVPPGRAESTATDDDAAALAAAVVGLRRRLGSVYGPAAAVLTIGRALRTAGHRPRSVREEQPLLVAGERPAVAPLPDVVPAGPRDYDRVLPASAAMFEEELGFSPFLGGAQQYRERVRGLIASGRVFIVPGDAPTPGVPAPDAPTPGAGARPPLRFKADVGVLSSRCAQIQGVWMHPEHRGRGLAAGAMAAVVGLARRHAPVVSLYVNAYNTAALRTYARVGFERVGTFATVLY